jgi:hypothetical protein
MMNFKIGDFVNIKNQSKNGTIIDIKGNYATVELSSNKTSIFNLKDLELDRTMKYQWSDLNAFMIRVKQEMEEKSPIMSGDIQNLIIDLNTSKDVNDFIEKVKYV